jgi:hypothetical protein
MNFNPPRIVRQIILSWIAKQIIHTSDYYIDPTDDSHSDIRLTDINEWKPEADEVRTTVVFDLQGITFDESMISRYNIAENNGTGNLAGVAYINFSLHSVAGTANESESLASFLTFGLSEYGDVVSNIHQGTVQDIVVNSMTPTMMIDDPIAGYDTVINCKCTLVYLTALEATREAIHLSTTLVVRNV